MPIDCYKLLHVSPDADENAIRKAWRLKTKDVHPDVKPAADSEEFIRLKEALEILLDPVKRLQHDRHFGYYSKPKNQDSNVKQEYSEFQKQKAETIVNAWNTDYEKAMQMREAQRQRVVLRHQRQRRLVLLALLAIGLGIAGWIVYKLLS